MVTGPGLRLGRVAAEAQYMQVQTLLAAALSLLPLPPHNVQAGE